MEIVRSWNDLYSVSAAMMSKSQASGSSRNTVLSADMPFRNGAGRQLDPEESRSSVFGDWVLIRCNQTESS